MQAFIDESGNAGYKFDKGSSRYFVVSMVVFDDDAQVENYEQKIKDLRQQLCVNQRFEFHFTQNSHRQRKLFLETISSFDFFIISTIIDKKLLLQQSDRPQNKLQLYDLTCKLLFTSARNYLHNATIRMDKAGNDDFRSRLRKFASKNLEKGALKSFRQQDSASNDLLQLADYVASIIRSDADHKKFTQEYKTYLVDHIMTEVKYP